LTHGFGFAGALRELDLSAGSRVQALLGYNLGVELGQVAIVLTLAPLVILLARRAPSVRSIVVRSLAGAIFVAGVYWMLDRALCG
jgi:hypothetical protein